MLALLAILLAQTPQPRLFMQPNLARRVSPNYPAPPPMPTPPSNTFYFAPSGGFGVGSGACRGQVLVDVSQNSVKYNRSAGTSGDGGTAVATCVRESDGLGVQLAASEPMVAEIPTALGTYGIVNEQAGTNFLNATNDLAASTWTATATVTRNAWSGPFSQYGTANGFESINDTSGAASQSVCQTLTTTTQTTYAFSCWLRSGTLTSARLSIAGTGNAAGNRTCTITSLDATLSRDDRKGCVTASAYGGGLSAVTVCVLPGSADADQGTVGAVDCQLEKNDHVTSYIPNGWPAGTSTRLVSTASVPTAPATLTLSETAGCAGADSYAQRYDAEAWWSLITMTGASARGPYNGSATTASTFDGTTAATLARSSVWNATNSAKAMWAADGGLSIFVYDAGYATAAYDGTMFGGSIAADSFLIESSNGSQDGIVANVRLDLNDYACVPATMSNITRVAWMGDSISARTTPDPVNPPLGFFLREGLNGTNMAVVGARFSAAASNCVSQWAVGGNGTYDTIVLWCGVNDILADALGAAVFAEELAWVQEWAYRGLKIYWFDIAPFKGYDSNAARLAERVAFNGLHTAYCAAPTTNVKCMTVSPVLADPGDSASLAPLYSFDGIHLTQAGATAASVYAASRYP